MKKETENDGKVFGEWNVGVTISTVVACLIAFGITSYCYTNTIQGLEWDLLCAENLGSNNKMVAEHNIKAHAQEIADIQEKHLKAQIIEPPENWIELHGDDIDSWTAYNANALVQAVRQLQQGKTLNIDSPVSKPKE